MATARTALGRRPATGDAEREIRPRPGLPGPRAVLGAFLVAASAAGIFAAYTSATAAPDHRYAVAARGLDIGHRIVAGDLVSVPLDLPPQVRGRAFSDPAALGGATLLVERAPGELIQASDVVRADGAPGTAEVSFAIDAARALGDRLRAGERVDVVATYGTGAQAYTAAVVTGVRVVRVRSAGGNLVNEGRLELTLELPGRAEVLALAHALDIASVTIARAAEGGAPAAVYRPEPGPEPEPEPGP